jgi:hypothetical protein
LLRQAKAVLAARPISHSSDMAIRGHALCSFPALLLAKELEDRLQRHGVAAEWGDILRDLDRLQEIQLEQDGKRFLLRTPTTGVAGKLFQAVGRGGRTIWIFTWAIDNSPRLIRSGSAVQLWPDLNTPLGRKIHKYNGLRRREAVLAPRGRG